MSSDSAVPFHRNPIILDEDSRERRPIFQVGFGGAAAGILAVVAAFPKPDVKIRSTNLKVSKEGCSPFSYVIIDSQTKTRTCIFTAGYPPMIPEDLSRDSSLSALEGAKLVYFDGRMHETALFIAREAFCKNISI